MGVDVGQLRTLVVRPALHYIELWSQAAENLVVGTALTESHGEFLRQLGGGPALGLWQMEPATHTDIWDNYLAFKDELADRVRGLQTVRADDFHEELVGNLFYAAAMCRVHYRRVKAPLPSSDDANGLASYWKRHYNTPAGAGTVSGALPYFVQACEGE